MRSVGKEWKTTETTGTTFKNRKKEFLPCKRAELERSKLSFKKMKTTETTGTTLKTEKELSKLSFKRKMTPNGHQK